MLSFFQKIGGNSKLGATKTDEFEASNKIVGANKDLNVVPGAETDRAKSRTRYCEGMLLKLHKSKIS